MILPDYTNSIVNFSCSILKHFNVTPKHNSIPEVDKGLEGKEKVIVFLFDGMGQALIKKHLKEDDFLRKHYLHTMWSTFPPTTVAATTAMLSGLYPIESGWMAWSQYFPALKRNIDVFKNEDSQTKEKLPLPNYQEERCSYESIFSQINKANGKEIAFQIMPDIVEKGGPKSIKDTIKRAYKKVNSIQGQSFVYSYSCLPDELIHEYGTTSFIVHHTTKKINRLVKKYSKKNPNVAALVIADHGLIDFEYLDMRKCPSLMDKEKYTLSFEKRGCMFQIKDGQQDAFRKEFEQNYGKYFDIYSKDEYIKMHMFGLAEPNEKSSPYLLDFIAPAKDKYLLLDCDVSHRMKGHHGGATLDEYLIDIALIK